MDMKRTAGKRLLSGARMGMARGRQAGSGMWRGAAVQVVCNAKVVGVIMIEVSRLEFLCATLNPF